MANPQIEDGYTPISNDVLQALAGIRIPGEATQVLFVILRKTWGFRKKVDSIPLSQFCEATGLLRPNVVRAINLLISMNLIYKNPSSSINIDTTQTDSINSNNKTSSYCFNKDYETWRLGGSIKNDNSGIKTDTTHKDYKPSIENNGVFNGVIKNDTTHKDSIKTDTLKRNIYINKNNINTVDFETIWKEYPNRQGKKSAERHFNASVKSEQDLEDIRTALLNYKTHLSRNTWKQPQNGSTWFNNWRDWIDWEEGKSGTDKQRSARAQIDYSEYERA